MLAGMAIGELYKNNAVPEVIFYERICRTDLPNKSSIKT